jgi:hypothetical protein
MKVAIKNMLPSPRVAAIALAATLAAAEARGAARTFVSVTGNDLNNCATQATPCRTFAAAIAQVDPGGEVLVLTSGSYGGATITKSARITVPSGIVAFTAASMVVAAGAADTVVLRGLTLSAATPGSGSGIDVQTANAVFIEDCVITGWQNGINVAGPIAHLFVSGTTVRLSGSNGIVTSVSGAQARATITRSRFDGSGNCGVFLGQGTTGTVFDTVAAENDFGFCVSTATGALSLTRCTAMDSNTGVATFSGSVARVSKSAVKSLVNNGATIESLQDNVVLSTTGTITPVSGH